ncbi:DNA modification methylase [[Ruminococcus] torques L2-14]|uniref:DNA modification methylase n=1 Tax=[Ruminococcus] torques L2-14 TaxID=657313 RepID=D4M0H2_9FIRM|nr:site-specific DNA-methyltransferase [[Ruminococcus] torques]CBL27532.1 DNA modification methylase [[Ruminococcus] torques L2-14]
MEGQMTFEFDKRPTIKGYPELRWTGKRPYESTQYYPAQLRERYGEETNGWINKIFWGDNLQVMSHLLKEYRGKIDLIYIDPPFDSKADYKKKIKMKNTGTALSDTSTFEEKQYGDIWTNDEYLQFMYERFILIRELLSERGSLYVHCDWHKVHHLRMVLDEVFGPSNFRNEVIWWYLWGGRGKTQWNSKHDNILFYSKSDNWTFNYMDVLDEHTLMTEGSKNRLNYAGAMVTTKSENSEIPQDKVLPSDTWYIATINAMAKEKENYPTQKPEELLSKIILASSNPGDIVFDCFMGSGTTQAVAMKLGRRFIGADINLGSIQTTTKRLINVANELNESLQDDEKYIGFEVYNVNNYDFFRNPVEARDLIIQALEIQPFPQSDVWDGELDGRMVKIMPVNRIATKADLEELKANLPYKTYEKRKAENPTQPVEKITIVCMGHEPDLKASLEQELSEYKLDIEIVDILRDKKDLQLKREAEAEIVKEGSKLVIRSFYPMNLMQKLSLQKEYVEDWRQLVESIMIDWNYDGVVMQPTITDVPDKKEIVSGIYDIPEDAGTIRVKITDLLSESLEMEVE